MFAGAHSTAGHASVHTPSNWQQIAVFKPTAAAESASKASTATQSAQTSSSDQDSGSSASSRLLNWQVHLRSLLIRITCCCAACLLHDLCFHRHQPTLWYDDPPCGVCAKGFARTSQSVAGFQCVCTMTCCRDSLVLAKQTAHCCKSYLAFVMAVVEPLA